MDNHETSWWLDKRVDSLKHVEIYDSTEDGTWTAFNHLTRQSLQLGELECVILSVAEATSNLSVREVAEATLYKLDQRFDRFGSTSDPQVLQVCESIVRLGQLGVLRVRGVGSQPRKFRLAEFLSPSRLLVLHLRGINPEDWLKKISPFCGLLYSRSMVWFWCVFASILSVLLLLDFDRLLPQARELGWLSQPGDGMMLLAIFVFTVAAHELGHAVVCTRMGARCPDMGLILMFGTPCVYCDVSEAWKLPSWKQRAAIAAAGIYTEMVIACLAAVVWLATSPGSANTIAFEIMMVSTVSTLLVNLNPLMRFDGYFILADLLREPSLRQKADGALRSIVQTVLGGDHGKNGNPQGAYHWFLAAFALLGSVYRVALSLAIAALSIYIADSWDLIWVGRFFALLLLWSWWYPAISKLLREVLRLPSTGRVRLAAPASLIVAVTLIPLPMRTFSVGWVEPQQAAGVYVESTGVLTASLVSDGDLVESGDLLFKFENSELAAELVAAELQVEKVRTKRSFQRHSRATNSNIDEAGEILSVSAMEQVLESVKERYRSLDLIASRKGRFASLWNDSDEAEQWQIRAARWTDQVQRGGTVESGTQLGVIYDGPQTAVSIIDTEQLESLEINGSVAMCAGDSGTVANGRVSKIIAYDDFQSPWPFANERGGAAEEDLFCVVIDMETPLPAILPGASVDLVFYTQPKTLVELTMEYLLGLQANLLD